MEKTSTYPIVQIPNKILESKRSFIPIHVHPMRPHTPTLDKLRYIGQISLVTMIVAICIYKFSSIPSITWLTASLTVLLVMSAAFAIYEIISNRLKALQNERKQESYDTQLNQYEEDLSEVEEIKTRNADPKLLEEYRMKKVKDILLITNISLKPVIGIGPKYFDCFYKMLIDSFPGKVLINYGLVDNKTNSNYIPNYVVAISDCKLYFDIEIDSPYSLDTKLPKTYVISDEKNGKNEFTFDNHNEYFEKQGWTVIRFAEEQVIKSPKSCCKKIAEVINDIIGDNTILQKFEDIESIIPIKVWTNEQCQRLAREQYRESYLPPKPKDKSEDEFLRNRKVLKIVENEEKDDQFFENYIEETKKDEKSTKVTKEEKSEPEKKEKSEKPIIIPIKTEPKIEIITNLSSNNMETSEKNLTTSQENEEKEIEVSANTESKPNRVNFGEQQDNKTLPLYMNITEEDSRDSIKVQTLVPEPVEEPQTQTEIQKKTVEEAIVEAAMEAKIKNENSEPIKVSDQTDNKTDNTAAEEKVSQSPQPKPIEMVAEKHIMEPDYSTKEAYDRKKIVELVSQMTEYHRFENWQLLLETCNKIIAIDPKFELAYMRRCAAYGNLGKLEEAIADSKKVTEINPSNADAYYNSGIANLMLKRYRNAIDDFRNAVDNNIANKGEIYLTIANIYNKLSDDINYREYLQKSANCENTNAKILINKIKQNENYSSESEFNGIITKHIEIAREGVSQIAFSVNDDFCAIADQSRKLRVFRTSDWEIAFKEDVAVSAMAFSRNNKYMAIGGHGLLRVLNIANSSFNLFSDITNFTGSIKKMFFHPYNNETLFVSDNFALWKVDIKTKVINKAISDFQLMATSRDMQYIAGKDYFNNIKIYRMNVLAETFKLKIDQSVQIKSMAINADCSRLIFGDSEGNIHIYNPLIPSSIAVTELKSEVFDIEISNTNFYAVLTNDRKLRFFNTTSAQKGREIQLKFLPKMMQISNMNNLLSIGNFNEDVDVLYVNDSVTETEQVSASQTA